MKCPHCGAEFEPEKQGELALAVPLTDYPVNRSSKEAVNRLTVSGSESSRKKVADEREILERVHRIVGAVEMQRNGGLWRFLARRQKRAILYALEDFDVRTPQQQSAIKNRPGWLMDRFKRAQREIEQGCWPTSTDERREVSM
jgi:hypothetical protein